MDYCFHLLTRKPRLRNCCVMPLGYLQFDWILLINCSSRWLCQFILPPAVYQYLPTSSSTLSVDRCTHFCNLLGDSLFSLAFPPSLVLWTVFHMLIARLGFSFWRPRFLFFASPLFILVFFFFLFNFLVTCRWYIFWVPVHFWSCELSIYSVTCCLTFLTCCTELYNFTLVKCFNLFLFELFFPRLALRIFPHANIFKILSSIFFNRKVF